jgi:Synaptobrevin
MNVPRHVKYLALAYNGKILASHLHWDREASENYENTLKQVFKSPGWQAVLVGNKSKFELKAGANVYAMEIDFEKRVYVAVVTQGYPTRNLFSLQIPTTLSNYGSTSSSNNAFSNRLFHDFRLYIASKYPEVSVSSPENGLQKTLKGYLKDLALQYDDLENLDKIEAVSRKTDNLKGKLYNIIEKATERDELIQNQADKTETLLKSSQLFHKNAKGIVSAMRRKKYCLYLFIFGGVVAIIIILVLILNYTVFHWW